MCKQQRHLKFILRCDDALNGCEDVVLQFSTFVSAETLVVGHTCHEVSRMLFKHRWIGTLKSWNVG